MFFRSCISAILVSILTLPVALSAEETALISSERRLYCKLLNDSSTILTKLNKSNDLIFVGFEEERASIQKRIRKTERKIKQLKQILRENDAENNNAEVKVRNFFRFLNGKKLTAKNIDVRKKAQKLLREFDKYKAELEATVATVDACENGELPDLHSGSLKVISFPFKDPDMGQQLYMYGIAILYEINPKSFKSVNLCVGSENRVFTPPLLPRLPSELLTNPQPNPCSHLYPAYFNNRPRCSGVDVDGNPKTAVIWVDVNFGSAPFPIITKEQYQQRADALGLVSVRKYTA